MTAVCHRSSFLVVITPALFATDQIQACAYVPLLRVLYLSSLKFSTRDLAPLILAARLNFQVLHSVTGKSQVFNFSLRDPQSPLPVVVRILPRYSSSSR